MVNGVPVEGNMKAHIDDQLRSPIYAGPGYRGMCIFKYKYTSFSYCASWVFVPFLSTISTYFAVYTLHWARTP